MLLLALAACHREPPAPPAVPTPYVARVPDFILPMPVPADNPLTVEGVDLGRHLFYDPLLSRDGSLSCASCHQQKYGFSDSRPVSLGVDGQAGRRNAMPLFNLAWEKAYFWDGRAATLEEQVMIPLQAPDEMARDVDLLVADLQKSTFYQSKFEAAFPGRGIDPTTIAHALAQFVRSIVSFSSPWDVDDQIAWRDAGAATRGHHLLSHPYPDVPGAQMLPCNECHTGDGAVDPQSRSVHRPGLFTSRTFRNNGLPPDPKDAGRAEPTKKPEDRGLFRVPSVRNLGLTGPYMHDGRIADLRDVIRHYAAGIAPSDTLDPLLVKDGAPLRIPLKDSEIEDILVFLQLLDDPSLTTNPAWSDPFAEGAKPVR